MNVTLVRATVALVFGLFWSWCADVIGLVWPIVVVIGLVVAGLIFMLLQVVEIGSEPERWEDMV